MEENTSKRGLSAGIIIIGDEILKGHVQDANSFYLCKQLWSLGIKVGKIAIVADELSDIAEEVKLMASLYDFVYTTGGIGPTHDDVTLEAVGKAFGEELYPHPDILKLLGIDENNETSSAWRKMAIVPKSTKVYHRPNDSGDFSFLLMVVKNVHCYPGVPSLFKSIFQQYKDLYSICQTQFYLKELFFSCDEDILAKPLAMVQGEYPNVQLGSYPNVSIVTNHSVKVSLESDDREQVEMAYSRLILSLPVAVMMSAKDNYSSSNKAITEARESVSWLLERLPSHQSTLLPGRLCQRLQKSIHILEEMLERYSFDEVCVAFNGGKDCTVILDLLHSVLKKRKHDFTTTKLKVLFVEPHQTFIETESFVDQSVSRYGLEVIRIKGSICNALSDLKTSHPRLKAVCMGTRHTDPHSDKLEPFSPTDSTWPEYMRVHCILEWPYSEVWLFLRLFQVPYCVLYDRGYTSLDGIKDTFPNPALLLKNSENVDEKTHSTTNSKTNTDKCSYLAAYMLTNEGLERAGRSSSKSSKLSSL